MIAEIRHVVKRSQSTLLADGLGAAALMIMLWVALHLPSLF
jgi:hypothetical protein